VYFSQLVYAKAKTSTRVRRGLEGESIERGLDDTKNGRVMSHEEARANIYKYIAEKYLGDDTELPLSQKAELNKRLEYYYNNPNDVMEREVVKSQRLSR